jgi:hypothetical protein
MEYLKYDEIFKKRCPECHGSDHAKKRFRKLFGKSFPENGGVVMNNFKYMKQHTDYKFDDRELALMYSSMNALQDASSDDDYEYEDDNDERQSRPTYVEQFGDIFKKTKNNVNNIPVLQRFVQAQGITPRGTGSNPSPENIKQFKANTKKDLLDYMKRESEKGDYTIDKFATFRDELEQAYFDSFIT